VKKVCFIGDIHGKFGWRELANEALARGETVVFIGDYIDSFHATYRQQKSNLLALIAFLRKKAPGHDVTALLGNHDYAYLHEYSQTSGYQNKYAFDYQSILRENIDLFDIAWEHTGKDGKVTLATHAGLTESYWTKAVLPEFKPGGFLNRILGQNSPGKLSIAEVLNYLKDKNDILWRVGPGRGGSRIPSPLWTATQELEKDPYPYINQVIGHTASHSPEIQFNKEGFIAKVDVFDKRIVGSLVINL